MLVSGQKLHWQVNGTPGADIPLPNPPISVVSPADGSELACESQLKEEPQSTSPHRVLSRFYEIVIGKKHLPDNPPGATSNWLLIKCLSITRTSTWS